MRKKNNKPFSMRMDSTVYERLEEYCQDTGQTKTTAIERILSAAAFDAHDKRKASEGATQESNGFGENKTS